MGGIMDGIVDLESDIAVVQGVSGDRLQYNLTLSRWCDRRAAGADCIANAFLPGAVARIADYLRGDLSETAYKRLRIKADCVDDSVLSYSLAAMGLPTLSELRLHPRRWALNMRQWAVVIDDQPTLYRLQQAFGSPDALADLKAISIVLSRD